MGVLQDVLAYRQKLANTFFILQFIRCKYVFQVPLVLADFHEFMEIPSM